MEAIREWWEKRDRRERRWVAALAFVVAVVTLYQFVVVPLQAASERNRTRIASERDRLSTMHARIDEVTALARKSPRTEVGDVAGVAREIVAALPVSSAEPPTIEPGERSVRVRIPATTFDAFVTALEPALARASVRAVEVAVVALATPGLVRVEMELAR